MSKKNIFKLPYVGVETADDELHLLLGQKGECSAVVQVINPVCQYGANPDEYLAFHQNMLNVVKIMGEGFWLQKLDVLSKERYSEQLSEEYLQQKYDQHFSGRSYTQIRTYLVIIMPGVGRSGSAAQKKYAGFRELVFKAVQSLELNGLKPVLLREKGINQLLMQLLAMDFSSPRPVLDNLCPSDTHIRMGNRMVKCLSLIDIDRIDLPEQVSPYIERNDNEVMRGFPVDSMFFLHQVPGFELMVYNQVLEIPRQLQTIQKLQLKKKRHSGIPDPENDLCVADIEKLLDDVARENQLLVNAHFSLLIAAPETSLPKAVSNVENALFLQGIIPSRNSYNQLELFRTVLPGNAVELKAYDLYLTTSDAALSFFFKESLPVSEPSPKGFSIRFTDRQGIPVRIDPADYSRETGRINNRNKFVLGPSGSGKSFFMNALSEQYLLYNMDIVIVDTGDSYSGICSYLGGKYITYKEDKPITMNPFVIRKEEFNLEKKDFLVTLIGLLWKGAEGSLSQVENDVINQVVMAYYRNYFGQSDADWIETAGILRLEEFLSENGISPAGIFELARSQLIPASERKVPDYYATLQIATDSNPEQIKKAYRQMAQRHHPDKLTGLEEAATERFVEIKQAFDILSNQKSRWEYDQSNYLINLEYSAKLNWDDKRLQTLQTIYGQLLRLKAAELAKACRIDSLSFNSFYEFALFLIPQIRHREQIDFNLDVFRFVLKKFYRGGEFAGILNEQADASLFDEPLIVFEIDNIKESRILFPIVTLIVMDVFIQKMRFRQQQRKALIIEESWKAIASPLMAGYLVYLYKTVRKFNGEAIVVTQELDDIIGNPIVKESIINNSDTICLLDQTKFKDNYEAVAKLLSINQVERRKIFTINNLSNKEGREPFKEVYIRRGHSGEVYGVEVSLHQYLTYTTEKPEKLAVETYVQKYGNYPLGLDCFVTDLKRSALSLSPFVQLVNLTGQPFSEDLFAVLHHYRNSYGHQAVVKIRQNMEDSGLSPEIWLSRQDCQAI